MNPSIFHAYDVRGLVPSELDEAAAYVIGQAFVRYTGAKTVVVGRDARRSSPGLFASLTRGLTSQGADVIDLGLVSTPMFYFAVGDYDLHDAGIMVTASHNPKQYNGLKFTTGDALPIGAVSGIYDLRDLAMTGPFPEQPAGRIVETSVKTDYLRRVLREVKPEGWRPLKVVIDGGNGMAGAVVREVIAALPSVTAEYLYIEPDGEFPNHEANPLKRETLFDLQTRVMAVKADLGVAFDGDADRIGFVDERGEYVPSDLLHALLATRLLAKHGPALIQYATNESMVIAEEVAAAGGTSLMTPVGHGVAKPIIKRTGALFGGEIAMHYYFRDFYGSECTDLVMLMVMEAMAESGKTFSELIAPLRRYYQSGEINSTVADSAAVLDKLEAAYGPTASVISKIDGLRLDFHDAADPSNDWWFGVRASNTEPLLRLNLEAKRREVMEARRDELLALIRR
jgi:phosphomannomutase